MTENSNLICKHCEKQFKSQYARDMHTHDVHKPRDSTDHLYKLFKYKADIEYEDDF